MSSESQPVINDGETRLVFTDARTGNIYHQAWAETTFVPIPRAGERVTLSAGAAEMNEDDQWEVEEADRLELLVKDVEYSYNYIGFKDEEKDINAQRLLTDVYIFGEAIPVDSEQSVGHGPGGI